MMTLKQSSLQFCVKVRNCLDIYIYFRLNCHYKLVCQNSNLYFIENNNIFWNGEPPGCILCSLLLDNW